jgi:hypothetical protein
VKQDLGLVDSEGMPVRLSNEELDHKVGMISSLILQRMFTPSKLVNL